ncbi:MAG: TolC family outer membrane protein [Pseudomonadota bacterium]
MLRLGLSNSSGLLSRNLTLLTAVGLLFIAVPTTNAAADTLPSVVQEALQTHPELGAIRFNRKAIDQELRAARGLGLPTLDAKTNYGRHRDSLKTAAGLETTDPWHLHRDISLIMSQRIFDGFERRHEVIRQKNRVESARWRVADTANSIALRTVQAYFELLRAGAVLRVARANLSSLRALQSHVSARVRAGHSDLAEQSEAGSRVASAQAILVEAEARLADGRSLFRAAVGRAPGRLHPGNFPQSALPRRLEVAVQQARSAAPSVIATEHDAGAAKAAIGSAYSRLYPKLNLELSSYHGKGIEARNDRDLDARAMLVVRWNIFNGGIDAARIREARARSNEAAQVAENTRRIVERETRSSWILMNAAKARVPALRKQLQLARQTRRIYSEQFDTGERRLLDLLDAQSEIFVADAALRTEQFVARFNAYRVLAAMGHLVWALGLEMPNEATKPHRKSLLDGWHTAVKRE